MDSAALFHTLYTTIINSQRHKKGSSSVTVILRANLYRSFVGGIVKKRALNQNKNTYKMLETVLIPEILGPPKIGDPRLKPF